MTQTICEGEADHDGDEGDFPRGAVRGRLMDQVLVSCAKLQRSPPPRVVLDANSSDEAAVSRTTHGASKIPCRVLCFHVLFEM